MPHNTSPAPSAAPPNALPLWTDNRSLFTELRSGSGLMVLRYPLTIQGLSSALALVRTHAYDGLDHAHAQAQRRLGTVDQQTHARDVLRSLGLLR